jgi:hypothetical protein
VNVATILTIPGMTSRAGATIASLMLIVVSAAAALIPVQGPQLLGAEILLFTAGTLVLTIDAAVRMIRAAVPPYVTGTWIKSFLTFLAIVPFGVGGIILLTGSYRGLYWLAAGFFGRVRRVGGQRLGTPDRDPALTPPVVRSPVDRSDQYPGLLLQARSTGITLRLSD